MAELPSGHLLNGVSGKLGNVVLRTRNGKTYLCAAPGSRKTQTTQHQMEVQHRFSVCTKMASRAIRDAQTRDHYKAEAFASGRSAYSLALLDALKAYDQGKIKS